MDRYHTDPTVRALIDRARAERTACIGAGFSACGRFVISLAGGMIPRRMRLSPSALAGPD